MSPVQTIWAADHGRQRRIPPFQLQKYKTWWVNKGRWDLWFSCHTCLELKKVFSKEIGKIGFMQNSLELHQSNMHIGFRVIPLSVHHSVTCQTPFLMESDPRCCNIFLIADLIRWRVRFRLKVSSLQPTCFRLWQHESYRDSLLLYFRCVLFQC